MSEVQRSTVAAPSTVFTRWVAPMLLVAAGLGFSVWVRANAHGGSKVGLVPAWFGLYGMPSVALLCLIGFRLIAGRVGRSGDLVLTWVIAFLVAIHTLHLMFAVGMMASLQVAIPLAAGVLYLGFALTLTGLEYQSPLGMRLPTTMASPAIWEKTHRLLGSMFVLAAMIAPLGALWPGPASLVLLGVGPAIALAAAAMHARSLARSNPASSGLEQSEPSERRSEESEDLGP